MPKLKPGTELPTAREEKEIARQAKEDDTLLTDEQLSEMKPAAEFAELQELVRRGRPRKDEPKQSTTIRLAPEVISFFKSHGKGWQTEINDVLKEYVDKRRSGREH
jgi:uncharacterized protein (DUF4415 family)